MIEFSLRDTPLPHQVAAFDKMRPSRVGALFMDMGTGKSLVVMMLAQARREKIDKVIWCCPVSLKRNTRDLIRHHTDCSPEAVYLFDDKTSTNGAISAPWVVVGLESIGSSDRVAMALHNLIDDRTMLVVDESSYIKGHKAKRTERLVAYGQRARYRLVLNGTPISQGIEDLYAQMLFLSERILGYRSWYSFRRNHLQYSSKYRGKIDCRLHSDWIGAKIAPYVYQVTKDECLKLPDKAYSNRYLPLTPAQQGYYDSVKERCIDEIADLDDDEAGIAVYRMFGALQMVVNSIVPAGYPDEGLIIDNYKDGELMALLDQLPGERVVVWVRFRANVIHLREMMLARGIRCAVYYGEQRERQREENLRRWRAEGGVLLATMACGGFGLTLTESPYAVFYGNGFKYAERLQAEDRQHRIGQYSTPLYISLWAECGIEARIQGAIESKGNALEAFRADVDRIKHLGKDQVVEFLRSL